ncbi:MAG: sulfatase family protein [Coraliomargaritaceae bacterium]
MLTYILGLLIGCSTVLAVEKPNVIFVLADDLGLGDVSFHSRSILEEEPVVETPTLDALASEGLWFTDGHSATALCAPTRYAVMSGNNNYRSYAPTGVWSTFAPSAFKPGEATLGSVMQDAGYLTGIIGKWHMGGDFYKKGSREIYRGAKSGNIVDKVELKEWAGSGPRYCGFDYDFISPCGIQGPLYLLYENEKWFPWAPDSEIVFLNEENAVNPKDLSSKGFGPGDSNWDAKGLGDLLSAKAVEFIEKSAADKRPFFLYYCTPMVHIPHCPPNQFDGQAIRGSTPTEHLDMVVELDLQIKRIVDALKSIGLYENTLIVVTSDNGGLLDAEATKNHSYKAGGGWRGHKSTPYEGGHRVPFFASWPGHIEPGICHELVVNQDLVATFASLVGTEIPRGQALDSNNLMPLFSGKGTFRKREYWVNQAGPKQEVMFRKMPWKLIIQSNFKRTSYEPKALYNLESDPKEKHDQIHNPEFQQLVKQMFEEYLSIIQSGRPTVSRR